MKKLLTRRILIPIFAASILFTGSAFKNDFFEIAKQIEIFTTLFKELNMNYVDETNPGELMDSAIKSMLNNLDPYTQFYNEQDVEAERIKRTGDYTGIGANIRTLKDKLIIIEPYKDYPADKAGLKAGDQIIKINGVSIEDYKDDAVNLLKGAPNSTVDVTYLRLGKENTATIKRSEIEIDAVPHFSMINDKTGYIVLSKFNTKTTSQTSYALKDLKAQGAENIILDLRNNPGGLLSEAVNIVNLFVPKGQLVVTTKSKVKKYNKTYYTQKEPLDTEIPLVVLINGNSASASEIVSGSLQDLDRAVIVGSRSFGKGLVQRPKLLTYGTQLKVTISRYYTPSGRCIQALDYWNRDEEGNATRVKQENYHVFKTKNGRKVFDGGGVLPDENLDNSKLSPITKAISGNFLIFDYATEYYYKNNIEDINSFKLTDADFTDFKNYVNASDFNFETKTEKALAEVLIEAEKEELDTDIQKDYNTLINNLNQSKNKAIDKNKEQILGLLTDEIVKRNVYREGLYEYYKIHNEEIKTATQILAKPSKYQSYLK
ncbi:S41 family peptidase [Oceanihabitans sediminis]|uniref:S41 family peptidase n=1 Tax=Oceanihabitans sediminis TaxID=1812012 RepID=A0A368P7V0_9FLAO|nr:S41 family peptidase [Oceanihabitans sediminis]MDX1277364.1 S41 family peptidase [Oceanihabitans sediminis]RBP34719.1 carboxyl-terminal processing protease [Oceanihabitans sediminis]RCU58370.1 S41 family peptidase [Oceanihabitans sediminis]